MNQASQFLIDNAVTIRVGLERDTVRFAHTAHRNEWCKMMINEERAFQFRGGDNLIVSFTLTSTEMETLGMKQRRRHEWKSLGNCDKV